MSNLRSVFHGNKSISYLGPKIWDIVPLELKELTSVVAFKKSIKKWKPKSCPFRLCKKYVSNFGFITVTSRAFLTFFIYTLFLRFILFKVSS